MMGSRHCDTSKRERQGDVSDKLKRRESCKPKKAGQVNDISISLPKSPKTFITTAKLDGSTTGTWESGRDGSCNGIVHQMKHKTEGRSAVVLYDQIPFLHSSKEAVTRNELITDD